MEEATCFVDRVKLIQMSPSLGNFPPFFASTALSFHWKLCVISCQSFSLGSELLQGRDFFNSLLDAY